MQLTPIDDAQGSERERQERPPLGTLHLLSSKARVQKTWSGAATEPVPLMSGH